MWICQSAKISRITMLIVKIVSIKKKLQLKTKV